MITIKNQEQIAYMRKAGALLYEVLQTVKEAVKPGISTMQLNDLAEEQIRRRGAEPTFLGYDGFPASLCTSINEVVVHGIPDQDRILKEGDIISLDCGLILDGWQSDSALTVPVGKVSEEALKLIRVTEECFFMGAKAALNGGRLTDIGDAVASTAERNGFSVVKDLTGHGIGRQMHEDPAVYNFGRPGHGPKLYQGMTIALEPMITAGTWKIEISEEDGWTASTLDGSLSAHYEHTMVINESGYPELLTLPGFIWKEEI